MKEVGEGDAEEVGKARKRQTLLQRFGIPIEHVDFKYVETCSDGKKLEKILRVLQSGEEGYYPDLEKCVATKLGAVDPTNRFLRVQVPILRPEALGTNERRELESDLSEWIKATSETERKTRSTSGSTPIPSIIFEPEDDPKSSGDPPIRGSNVIMKSDTAKSLIGGGGDEIPFLKPANPNRIKSWEYDKWNKFNVDTELMKLDIQDMKAEEAERVKMFKGTNQRDKTGPDQSGSGNGKNAPADSLRPCCFKSFLGNSGKLAQTKPSGSSRGPSSSSLGRSFIEELPNDPILEQVEKKSESKRRFKITIDDINVGGF